MEFLSLQRYWEEFMQKIKYNVSLGANIRALRRDCGLTQETLKACFHAELDSWNTIS